MKQIYIVRKYVYAESVEEAVRLEKKTKPADVYLTDYSTALHMETLQPRKDPTGFKKKENGKEEQQ